MSLPDKNVHIYKKVKRKIERKIKYIYIEKKKVSTALDTIVDYIFEFYYSTNYIYKHLFRVIIIIVEFKI